MIWTCRDRLIDCTRKTLIMGVVNVTPDSFSDGGIHFGTDAAVEGAMNMAESGADILDIGGESSRPGSLEISADEEWERIGPVIERIRPALPDAFISVDTCKSEVARRALDCGADIVNDIHALRHDPEMAPTVARWRAGVVLMHMKGEPRTMQNDPQYADVVSEVRDFLGDRVRAAMIAGIAPESIVLDPGIGFGKTIQHNLALLAATDILCAIGRPVLIGVSRKAFIGHLTGGAPPNEREEGTIAACCAAVLKGAAIVRVHNAQGVSRAMAVIDAIKKAAFPV